MADVICIEGEWTIHAAASLREGLLQQVNKGAHTFDLGAVTELDSAGLQLLLAAQRSLARQGREMVLTACSPAVTQVLKIYGLDSDLRPLDALTDPQEKLA